MADTVLLIDADIIAYKAAAMAEQKTAFGKTKGDLFKACDDADKNIGELSEKLKADRVIICLSDSENFRYSILPTYKSNRIGTERPQVLQEVKDYLASDYESWSYPTLEADDTMAILATHDHAVSGEKIIVSDDKDLWGVPAKIYRPCKPKLGVIEQSQLDADRFHLWQSIVGDTADGYKGANGVGPKSVYAEEILIASREELWDVVLDAFASVGLNETDAIQQARVAKMLTCRDYDVLSQTRRDWWPEDLLEGTGEEDR